MGNSRRDKVTALKELIESSINPLYLDFVYVVFPFIDGNFWRLWILHKSCVSLLFKVEAAGNLRRDKVTALKGLIESSINPLNLSFFLDRSSQEFKTRGRVKPRAHWILHKSFVSLLFFRWKQLGMQDQGPGQAEGSFVRVNQGFLRSIVAPAHVGLGCNRESGRAIFSLPNQSRAGGPPKCRHTDCVLTTRKTNNADWGMTFCNIEPPID